MCVLGVIAYLLAAVCNSNIEKRNDRWFSAKIIAFQVHFVLFHKLEQLTSLKKFLKQPVFRDKNRPN